MKWWNQGAYPLKIGHSNFLKVIDFYLFHCPVDKKGKEIVSARGKTFRERNITDKKLRALLAEMKKDIEHYELADEHCKVEERVFIAENSKKYNNTEFQMIIFYENKDLGKTKTIFYAIRNAFAHGSFSVKPSKGEKIYYFENRYQKIIKAQFRIKETTLLKWIDLIKKYTT